MARIWWNPGNIVLGVIYIATVQRIPDIKFIASILAETRAWERSILSQIFLGRSEDHRSNTINSPVINRDSFGHIQGGREIAAELSAFLPEKTLCSYYCLCVTLCFRLFTVFRFLSTANSHSKVVRLSHLLTRNSLNASRANLYAFCFHIFYITVKNLILWPIFPGFLLVPFYDPDNVSIRLILIWNEKCCAFYLILLREFWKRTIRKAYLDQINML